MDLPGSDFDVMRDVYMTKAQREAFDRIAEKARALDGHSPPAIGHISVESARALREGRVGGTVFAKPFDLNNVPIYTTCQPRLLVPGVMRCAKCEFQLQRVNLHVDSGTLSAGGNETEPCPNGCGPLWPVTWEQYAKEAMQRLDEIYFGPVGDVIRERQAQESKWGQQNHPWLDPVLLNRNGGASPQRLAEEYEIPTESRAKFLCENAFKIGIGSYAHILVEEVAEAVAEQDEAKARIELIQVAAVAVAAVEAIDRRAAAPTTED